MAKKAKKKSAEKPQRHVTKRALSNIKRQKRRQRFILYGGIVIVVAIIAIVVTGVLRWEVLPYRETVIKVYDRGFSAQYVIDAIKYTYNSLGLPAEYISQYLSSIVQSVPTYIQEAELIKRGAEELGIVVSDAEVKAYLIANGAVVNDASIDMARTIIITDRLYEEYFLANVAANADQAYLMAMFLESESKADEIREELESGGDFADLALENSVDLETKDKSGDLGWHIREFLEAEIDSTVLLDYGFSGPIGVLSQPLEDAERSKPIGYWVVNILDRPTEDSADVEVILVGSVAEADEIILKLMDGEVFSDLAKEYSQDDSAEDGGDLGVVTEGDRSDAFDGYVFADGYTEVGILGPFHDEGVSTKGGYWLVKVVDRELDRPLEEEDKEFLADEEYDDWIDQLWDDATDALDMSPLTLEKLQWIMQEVTEELS